MHTIQTSNSHSGQIKRWIFNQALCNAINDGLAYTKGYSNNATITLNVALLHNDHVELYYNNVPAILHEMDGNYRITTVAIKNAGIVFDGYEIVNDSFF